MFASLPASDSSYLLKIVAAANTFTTRPEIDLMVRVKLNDPAVIQVNMWETKTFNVCSGEAKSIFTPGLAGCNVIAIIAKHRNGTREITLSHYPVTFIDNQVNDIRNTLAALSQIKNDSNIEGSDIHIFVLAMGREISYGKENSLLLVEQEDSNVPQIKDAISTCLPSIKPTVLLYPDLLCSEKKSADSSSAFVLHIPSESEFPIKYDGIFQGEL